jgi:FAD/FMN-containing dehydrogenase/Fe-S oxidoreductase
MQDKIKRKNDTLRSGTSSTLDAKALASELRTKIEGEVRFDDGSRALYSTDGSNYRQVPIGVVIPKSIDDVIETVKTARRFGAPVLARGGGTSLAGQCCNVAVVMDMSKYMNKIIEIDPEKKRARVQPGVVLDDLRDAAEKHTLTFGPDPATHTHCTLGGMIGNNSCGVHSVMAGNTAENVEELEILTYDGLHMRVGKTSDRDIERIISEGGRQGEIYLKLKSLRDEYADLIRKRFPNIPRRVSGYNLPELLPESGFHVARALVGSECTCVTILEATVRLVYSPPVRSLLVLGYPDVYIAGDHIMEILSHKPIGLEGLDNFLVEDMKKKGLHPSDVKLLPEGGGWLLVEFGGESKKEADDKARGLMDELKKKGNLPSMKLFDDPEAEKTIWTVRESGLGATARVPGEKDTWEGWEDSSVPPEKLGGYLRDLRKLFNKYNYACSLYGHFGQGCVHTRIDFDLVTKEGIERYRSFIHEAAHLVVGYGGSLSGEHGDGQSRGELLPIMFGDELMEAFREFKSIWDPEWKMNPGKLINAYRADENLRLGTDYNPWKPRTHFKFPDDDGSFARATVRCVGVGECRRERGKTMCPSYRVTREEMHSTRGRAHLLFEMLEGNVVGKNGWRDESVKEALDLCLSCKGCKGDCPVNVDMATYKSEFLSHYYEERIRPRYAYAFGYIHWWSQLASLIPDVANFFTQTPLLRDVAKVMADIAPQRQIPRFARQTFKDWFHQRNGKRNDNNGKPNVILWPDTFNNHFHPTTAQAAVEVLEAAGFHVEVPRESMCCGRPLYDYGFLDAAKRWLQDILDTIRPQIRDGIPIVVLEPSCAAVFRDELINIFPHDEDAKRLSRQTFLLSDFLEKKAKGYQPPKLNRKAVVHGHCHHKAIMGMNSEKQILSKLGVDFKLLDSGCCGMAGAFGFEKDHYDVSIKVGEHELLPYVRNAAKDTLILANGFSCREQISQTTDRHALHLAQIIQMAMHEGPYGPGGNYPERKYIEKENSKQLQPTLRTAAIIGAGLLVGGALVWGLSRRKP